MRFLPGRIARACPNLTNEGPRRDNDSRNRMAYFRWRPSWANILRLKPKWDLYNCLLLINLNVIDLTKSYCGCRKIVYNTTFMTLQHILKLNYLVLNYVLPFNWSELLIPYNTLPDDELDQVRKKDVEDFGSTTKNFHGTSKPITLEEKKLFLLFYYYFFGSIIT